MSRLLVVGDVLVDVSARLRGAFAEDSDTPADVSLHPGGSGANLARWLAALGLAPTLVAAVGDDRMGRIQLEELERAGVRTRLAVVPGTATGVVVALVASDGRRSMVTSRGAADALRSEHLPDDVLRSSAHLHLSGHVLLGEGSRGAGLAALAAARTAGMTISVGASSSEPLRRAGPLRFRTWIASVDVLFANLEEGRRLTGSNDPDGIVDALALHHREVVLTLGAEGAIWNGPEGRRRAPALPAAVLDTTGAGDAFAAGWLAGWLTGHAGAAPLNRGLAAAALCVARAGAGPGSGA